MFRSFQQQEGAGGESSIRDRSSSRESFFLHLRPRAYPAAAIAFRNTWYLGFLSMFLLALELVTGIALMVYYLPSPDGAYGSVVRITDLVPLGWLIRDLHRLGGELMIVVVVLHLLRVFLADSHRGKAAFTWVSGVVLLLCTLMLAFSGYLLPWDQLAYWAVTIGTSMAETIPLVGTTLVDLLRGGPEFGGDGLLRFYLLHVVALPLVMAVFLAIHYSRVSRLHSISLPLGWSGKAGSGSGRARRIALVPTLILSEWFWSLVVLAVLIGVAILLYDAPLGWHADPRHTPAQTRAPWFFLWLQGALKLGDSLVMGVCFPVLLIGGLLLLPYCRRGARRPLSRRPAAMAATALMAGLLVWLSVLGLPHYGFSEDPVSSLLHRLVPEERPSRFHRLGYDGLVQGVYTTGEVLSGQPAGPLAEFMNQFDRDLEQLEQQMPAISGVEGVVIVEDWQAGLKKVTVRISWLPEGEGQPPRSLETAAYVHQASSGGTGASRS